MLTVNMVHDVSVKIGSSEKHNPAVYSSLLPK